MSLKKGKVDVRMKLDKGLWKGVMHFKLDHPEIRNREEAVETLLRKALKEEL